MLWLFCGASDALYFGLWSASVNAAALHCTMPLFLWIISSLSTAFTMHACFLLLLQYSFRHVGNEYLLCFFSFFEQYLHNSSQYACMYITMSISNDIFIRLIHYMSSNMNSSMNDEICANSAYESLWVNHIDQILLSEICWLMTLAADSVPYIHITRIMLQFIALFIPGCGNSKSLSNIDLIIIISAILAELRRYMFSVSHLQHILMSSPADLIRPEISNIMLLSSLW